MQKWKRLLLTATLLCLGFLINNDSVKAKFVEDKLVYENIQNVTGIADVYGDGEKVIAAILTYPKEISSQKLSPDDFYVKGKTIEAVYVNNKPEITDKNKSGRYVILKFAYQNTASDKAPTKRPGVDKKPARKDAPMRSNRKAPNLSFSVKQVGTVKAVDGTIYSPTNQSIESTSTKAPIIESFKQFSYTDPNGVSMPYNIYLPKNYNPKKKYPMVVFIADASANINEETAPLFQGNGATVFATPEWQKENECIVLAPQYTDDLVAKLGMMTTDENVWTPGLNLVTNLIFDAVDRYSVDRNRIYGTGQSQGGMANIAIGAKYPSLFAAQYLVACQWNVDEMESLKDKHLWITVCEGDAKAFPGMNEAVERWESLGANVARNGEFWNSKSSISQLDKQVKDLIKQNPNANINYTVFAGGNHMYTWSFAYNIDAIRDWLFAQSKSVKGKRLIK